MPDRGLYARKNRHFLIWIKSGLATLRQRPPTRDAQFELPMARLLTGERKPYAPPRLEQPQA